ncbi:hypothetical protein CEXT_456021 [Caerostris extrusa]|uniref:HNH homing endonuclease n=1 Tax=Caerostris extrusa TaxID=172846 RepID=A0AAV4YG66_CAEEX|nr:hypothetical protein CEXT_456021 [Caerostris extrusa]
MASRNGCSLLANNIHNNNNKVGRRGFGGGYECLDAAHLIPLECKILRSINFSTGRCATKAECLKEFFEESG